MHHCVWARLADELDSYTFQTVGHEVIELLAKALELPLFRVRLNGTAVNQVLPFFCQWGAPHFSFSNVFDERTSFQRAGAHV